MSIRLSKKHGLNPTIPVCFWCGKPKNEIAILGKIGKKNEDPEAPRYSVLNFEPCETCAENMKLGFTVVEVTPNPNSRCNVPMTALDGQEIYPTGSWKVVKLKPAKEIFGEETVKHKKCFVDTELFKHLFPEETEPEV